MIQKQEQEQEQEQEQNSPDLICTNDKKGNSNAAWETMHKRVTFYCPKELLGTLNKLSSSLGVSKSKLIVEGIHLVIAAKSTMTS